MPQVSPVIESKRQELEALCKKYRVKRLYVFGSAVYGDFDPDKSDLDFLVEFLPLRPAAHGDAFLELITELEDLFGRHVDLVERKSIRNRYFRREVESTKATVYAA